MAGSRTLKLSILADVDDLKNKLGSADKEVEGFGSKVSDFGKKAGLAFAAAGAAAAAYAGKLLIDGVNSAIEDEKAQAALAGTLERVAGATKENVKEIENYIAKTAIAKGFTDDELRPAFGRLAQATKDTGEAQKLLNLAMDISAQTGKPLEAVANALGKAYDGNSKALQRLGIDVTNETTVLKDNTAQKQAVERAQLAYNQALEKYGMMSPQAEKASLLLNQAQEKLGNSTTITKNSTATLAELLPQLTEQFGGAALEQADTFAGKMLRLSIAFDEAKETAGSFILDAITPLVTQFVDKGIPAIQSFSEELGPKLEPIIKGVSKFVQETLLPATKNWYEFLYLKLIPFLSNTFKPVFEGLKTAFNTIKKAIDDNQEGFQKLKPVIKVVAEFIRDKVAPILSGTFKVALIAIGKIVGGLVDGFGSLAGFIGDAYNALVNFINLIKNNAIVKGVSSLIDKAFGGGKALGGAVNSSQSYLVGERGPELFVPNSAGRIVPNNSMGGQSIVINVNAPSAIDEEGFTRSIINALNQTQARTGAGAGQLVFG